MQGIETSRRVGFLMIAVAVLLTSFVIAAPQASATNSNRDTNTITSTTTDSSELKPVVVKIVQASCDYRDGVSETNTTFSFRHNGINTSGKVEMTVTGPSGTYVLTEKTEIELAAGTYTWTAKSIHSDYELQPPFSGEFVNPECGPELEIIEVSVTPGTCEFIDGESVTTVTFSVDDGATLSIWGPDGLIDEYTESGSIDVGPGDYTWSAQGDEDHAVAEPSSGEFEAFACDEELQPVTVALNLGPCVWDGENSLTGVTASITPDGGATVKVDGTIDFTFDGQTWSVGPGTHTWEASAAEHFQLTSDSTGEFTFKAETCVPPSSLGDTVWHDIDADGVQGGDEPGVPDVDVSLQVEGVTVAVDMTDENGKYLFEDLEPGVEYAVVFTIPDTWAFTTPNVGSDDAVDSDVVGVTGPIGQTEEVTLAAGEVNLTVDAGIYLIEVLPDTPVTPITPVTPTTPKPDTPVTPTPNTPTTPTTPTTATEVDDTKVLGIQTELPATGMDDWRAGLLALALVMAGAGILLVARKQEDDLVVVGLN